MIRVMIAEDTGILPETLRTLLELQDELEVVADVGHGDRIEVTALEHRPDVAIIDIDLPGIDGLTATARLQASLPSCRALILTGHARPQYLRTAVDAGAAGFLLKDTPATELIAAIRKVAAGEQVIDSDLAAATLRSPVNPLSPREVEVLRAYAAGVEPKRIAGDLHLSYGTVRNYLAAAMTKLALPTGSTPSASPPKPVGSDGAQRGACTVIYFGGMAPGLTDEQIAQLRDEVIAGKSPRVRIAGSRFGGGAVRKVGDPAIDGDDYVTVRVKVDGVTDDLRFAPRELSRGRNAPAKRSAHKSPAPSRTGAAPAGPREATPVTRTTSDSAPGTRPATPTRRATTSSAAPASAPPASAPRRPVVAATAAKRGGRKAASAASVTITLKSAGTSWTVSAQRGAKSVAKNVNVNPGVVSAVAGLLQVSSLEEAVAAVNDTARVEAEVRAEELRAELARIQAVLDSHRLP